MHKQLLSTVLLTLALAAPAAAKEIKIPEGKPQAAIAFPDDWMVTFDEAGMQAVSPQTDSFVYGKILKRPKDEGNAWLADVLVKLQARGVVFKTNDKAAAAKPPAAVVAPTPSTMPASPAAPVSEPPALNAGPGLAKAAPAAPESPGQSTDAAAAASIQGVAPQNLSVPSLALLNEGVTLPAAPHKGPQLPFHALPYKDTERNGAPVDVELLTFILPDKSAFFLVQESGPTDPRMTDIINSVKPAH